MLYKSEAYERDRDFVTVLYPHKNKTNEKLSFFRYFFGLFHICHLLVE